jgi:hypothetical protein
MWNIANQIRLATTISPDFGVPWFRQDCGLGVNVTEECHERADDCQTAEIPSNCFFGSLSLAFPFHCTNTISR